MTAIELATLSSMGLASVLTVFVWAFLALKKVFKAIIPTSRKEVVREDSKPTLVGMGPGIPYGNTKVATAREKELEHRIEYLQQDFQVLVRENRRLRDELERSRSPFWSSRYDLHMLQALKPSDFKINSM